MNQTEVVRNLERVKSSYRWSVNERGAIIGTPVNHSSSARVKTYNPLTALARSERLGQYSLSKTGTALNRLGVPVERQRSLIEAVQRDGHYGGWCKHLRREIRSVLGV